jgi:hypothetical protein
VKLFALFVLLACGCQAPPAAEEDWTNFYEHQPTSILVLPVQNETSAAEAPIAFSSTITHPLVERGYYVFPVQPTLAILEANGIYEGGQLDTIAPQKFFEILGADALLYVTLKSWDTHYAIITSSVEVAMDYRMVDAHTGELLWQNSARQVVSSNSGNGGGDALGALLYALVESAVNASSSDYVPLARQANVAALGALPPGPLSEAHAKVRQELLARSKPAPAKPKP